MKRERYAGIDLHRKNSVVTVMDKDGYVEISKSIKNEDTEELVQVLSKPNTNTHVAVESTYGWYWIADLIDRIPNVEMTLGNTLGIKALSMSGKKTDKIDSKLLADLYRCNLFPEAHMTTRSHRDLKEVLRHRTFLIQKRGDVKRRLHSILAKINKTLPYTDICGKKSRVWMFENVNFYPYDLEVKTSYELLDTFDTEIKDMDVELEKVAKNHPDIDLITSVPGIGLVVGLTLLSEIDGVERFPHPRKLCSYAGLVPTVKSSGEHTTYGRCKKGNMIIRTMLAESIYHAIKKDPFLKKKYEELSVTKGKGKSKVIVMRKLLTSIYFVLKNKEPYRVHLI